MGGSPDGGDRGQEKEGRAIGTAWTAAMKEVKRVMFLERFYFDGELEDQRNQ